MKFGIQLGNWNFGLFSNAATEAYDNGGGAKMFMPLNGFGDTVFYNLNNEQQFLNAYNLCSPLKSIIGKRAKAFNNGKLEFIKESNGNYAKGEYVDDIAKLLKKPNALQSGIQFFTQQNTYIDIFGYCPVLKVKPVGFSEPSSLWNIPPYLINEFEFTGKWLKQKSLKDIYKKLTITWDGQSVDLDLNDVYFVCDDGIGTDLDTNLTIPDSRLIGLEYPVSNIVASYKSRNTLITKRGAIGILTNDSKDQAGTIPLPTNEKDNLQLDFSQYGLTGQPKQVIISEASLKWQQMGFSTKDLLLFEEIEDNISRICDSYGYPIELISSTKQTSYENKRQAKKGFYRDTIIPEAESRMQQNSIGIIPEDKGIVIKIDYSDIDVIQEELKDKAEARKTLNDALQIEYDKGLITKNMWLIELGRDTVQDEAFNQYKSEEIIINEPITQQN